jgi:hypothetical protein
MDCTMADAVEHEHARRLVAERTGYRVLGGPRMGRQGVEAGDAKSGSACGRPAVAGESTW